MRVGVVGVGRIGAAHAKVLSQHPDVEDLLLADLVPSRSAEVAERLPLVISSATNTHAELILAGARAGLPIFCEKPTVLDVALTHRIVDEVHETGIQIQMGFQRRFDEGYACARRSLLTVRLASFIVFMSSEPTRSLRIRRTFRLGTATSPPPQGPSS